MKLLGGRWSVVNFCIFVAAVAAVLTIPGMPKILHLDSGNSTAHLDVDPPKSAASDPKPDISKRSPATNGRVTRPRSPEKEGQSKGTSTVPGGAEIESVGPISAKAWQTIVIKGVHFGPAQPYNGCSDFLHVTDITDGRGFGAFAPGRFCYSGLYVTSWSDTEIVIEAFTPFKQGQDAFKVGDIIKIDVANPSQSQWVGGAPVASYSARVETEETDASEQSPASPAENQPAPSGRASAVAGGPEIASVGPVSTKARQTIVIKGVHFGPAQPYNGCSDFLHVTDITDGRGFGAFAPGRFCYSGLYVTSWSDTEIVIEAFTPFKQGQDAFKVGDIIKIDVANPSQSQWVGGAPVASYSVRVH